MTYPTSQRSSLREEGYSAQDNYYKARLKNILVCRHPGLLFPVHPAGRKFFFFHFEMERIALILIYLT